MRAWRGVITVLVAGAFAAGASAAIVIDYDPNDNDTFGTGDFGNPTGAVTSDLDGDSAADDVTAWVQGNTNVNAVIDVGAGYTGPTYYGVIRSTRLDAASISYDDRDGTPAYVRMQGLAESIQWLLYFKTGSNVTLNSASYIAFAENGAETTKEISKYESIDFARWVVLAASGNFYVSDVAISNSNDGATLNGNELFGLGGETAVNWALAPFAAQLDQNLAGLTYNVSTADLNAIGLRGFGMYLGEQGLDAGVNDRFWFGFKAFTVDAVPEPTALALLGLGGVGLLLRRRR